MYVNNHTDNNDVQGGGLFDRYFAQVEDIVQKMQELKSKWSSDLSAKEMEEISGKKKKLQHSFFRKGLSSWTVTGFLNSHWIPR